MKTLILSCNTGQGHNSCAQAIKEYYDQQGEVCDVEDALRFVSPSLSQFMAWGHATMYRHFSWAFRAGYQYAEKHPVLFWEKTGIYKLFGEGAERMHRFISAGGYDAVICTHAFAGVILTNMLQKHPMQIATCSVGTDYTCNPGTKDGKLDLCFIPDPSLSDEYECETISKEQIRVTGIPLRQAFYQHVPQENAKRKFEIPLVHAHLLLMCGSMGCGPLEKLTGDFAREAEPDVDLTIVCGTNRELLHRLRQEYADAINVHMCGYVHDMPTLMDSADLLLTKPGGISTTEAAMKNLPMILIDAVGGLRGVQHGVFRAKRRG